MSAAPASSLVPFDRPAVPDLQASRNIATRALAPSNAVAMSSQLIVVAFRSVDWSSHAQQLACGTRQYDRIPVCSGDGRRRAAQACRFMDGRHGGSDRILDRENRIAWHLAILPHNSKILGTTWPHPRSITKTPGHELASNVGHPTRDDLCPAKPGSLDFAQPKLAREFINDLVAGTVLQWLLYKVARSIAAQAVAPEDI